MTPTADELLEMIEEMPARVRVAVISLCVSLQSRWRVQWSEWERDVWSYIAAIGLFDVRVSEFGTLTVYANETTALLNTHRARLLDADTAALNVEVHS